MLSAGAWPGSITSADQTAGNGFYTVTVADGQDGGGTGVFAAATGPIHPTGDAKSVLFHGDASGNKHGSYLTVRSWTTGTDYVQTQAPLSSPNLIARLNDAGVTTPLTAGFRTAYDVTAPDTLRVVADAFVEGEGEDSSIVLRAEITNAGDVPAALSARYLLDFELAGDDGPAFAQPAGAELDARERSYPALSEFQLESTSASPGLRIFGRTFPPAGAVTFAYWPEASAAAFEYEPAARDIATDGGLNDGALAVYFGATETDAFRLAPGESFAVSIALSHKRFTGAAPPPVPVPVPEPVPQPGPPMLPAELPATGGRPR